MTVTAGIAENIKSLNDLRAKFKGGIAPRNTDDFLARFRRVNLPIPKESPSQGKR